MNQIKPQEIICLIDGNNTCFRVGWANRHLTNHGEPTGVIFGFVKELLAVWERWKNAKIAIAWDSKSEKRLTISKQAIIDGLITEEQGYYKQNRERKKEKDLSEGKVNEIAESIDIQKETLIEVLNMTLAKQIKIDGYEADDIIGTLATIHSNRGDQVKIISSDKDMYQLLSQNVSIWIPSGKGSTSYESFYGEYGIEPKQWIDIGAIAGDRCFTGDTLVRLLNGQTKSMEEIAKEYKNKHFWVYSCDQHGRIVPGKASKPKKTIENAPIVKVTLDNGDFIRCTANHRFMLKSGKYKKAKDLTIEDSLMPLYYRYDKFGYEEVLSNFNQKWYKTHRVSASNAITRQKQIAAKKYGEDGIVVHHIDCNKLNNSPENLSWLGSLEHISLHCSTNKERWKNPEYRKYMTEVVCSKAGKIGGKNTWNQHKNEILERLKTMRESMTDEQKSKGIIEYNKSKQNKPKARKNILNYHYSDDFKEKRSFAAKKRSQRKCHKDRIAKIGRKQCLSMNSNPEINKKQLIGRIKKVVERVIVSYGKIEKDGYCQSRRGNDPTWEKAIEVMGDAIYDVNHKIISVEPDGFADVYDFEVEKFHNFALACGVFVHNSDNIPGVPGIAEKIALKMLSQTEEELEIERGTGSYKDVICWAENKEKKKKKEEKLIECKELLDVSYELKKIIIDMDCVDFVSFDKSNPIKLKKMFEGLGFQSIFDKVGLLSRRSN